MEEARERYPKTITLDELNKIIKKKKSQFAFLKDCIL